jgi:hypothetical protein
MPNNNLSVSNLLNVFTLILGLCLSVGARADHGIDAYVFQAGASVNILPEHALNGKGYLVKPNPSAMQNKHITFQLPGGQETHGIRFSGSVLGWTVQGQGGWNRHHE